MKLYQRLGILIGVSVLGLISIAAFALYTLNTTMREDRQTEIHSVLNLAAQEVYAYQALAKSGKMTDQAARAAAIQALSGMREGKKSYVWARTVGALGLVHPDPRVIGKVDQGQVLPDGRTNWQKYLDSLATSRFAYFIEPARRPGSDVWVPKMVGVTRIDGWDWVVGYGVWADDIDAAYWSMAWRFIGLGAVLLLAVAGLAIVLTRAIYRQIGGEPADAVAIAHAIASGDMSRHPQHAPDSASLLGAVLSMQDSLRRIIEHIQQTAGQLSGTTGDLSLEMRNISEASRLSSDAAGSTAAAIEQLSTSIQHISDSAKQTEIASSAVHDRAVDGKGLAGRATDNIRSVAVCVDEAAAQVSGLVERSGRIGQIANVIKDIADQTNLLALNAAIEAARAGETGRGFAVVADEVRKLAERTTQATGQIADVIVDIQTETEKAVAGMTAIKPRVADGVERVGETASALDAIGHGIEDSLAQVRSVAAATAEQTTASHSVAQNIERIAQQVEASSRAAETASASAEALEALAGELRQSVARFNF
jgi:methyl-accepting chemotaxis protein